MSRNLDLEVEMKSICEEIYPQMKVSFPIFPKIESKQGGSSGVYYSNEHTIRFRWNVWNKLCLAGKRMLAIHEMYHAVGNKHNSMKLYCTAFDILSIEWYKKIYGEDKPYKKMVDRIKEII